MAQHRDNGDPGLPDFSSSSRAGLPDFDREETGPRPYSRQSERSRSASLAIVLSVAGVTVVVLAVVAMGVASSKMTDRAIRSQFGPEPDEAEGAGGADRAGFGPDGPAD